MTVQIRDSDGTVRLSGDLLATGGATGDVLTQQADGTYAPDTVSGLPSEWTVAADGGLTIGISDNEGLFTLQLGANASQSVQTAVVDNGDGTTTASVQARSTGGGTGGAAGVYSVQNGGVGAASGTANLYGDGTLELFTASGRTPVTVWDGEGNVLGFAVLNAGQPVIGAVAAPADAALSASQCALWFDDNNATPALKIKAKTADGTVVTGTVLLT